MGLAPEGSQQPFPPGHLHPHLQHFQWLLYSQRKSLGLHGAAKPENVSEAAGGSQVSFPAVGITQHLEGPKACLENQSHWDNPETFPISDM